ncbi:jg21773 [Pararge aegeria aegeria]|uniref:Jg21773 protein n=1 Tax=Pararge aegeria aegeria TaxID=348720 RepID=A0A8S4R5L3_9NEOP|nr:jg21773 [Pararge aegeria aegeria]
MRRFLFLSCLLTYMSAENSTKNHTSNATAEVFAEEDTQANVIYLLGQGIQKEIQAVKQPIDEAIINFGSSTCAHVQKLFGMSYDQMKGEKAPNMDNLALVYKTKFFTTIMNITTAAEGLRRLRQLDQDRRLILFLHGFTDDPTKEAFANLTNSFFATEQVSLIALDASPHIRWLYYRSSAVVQFIGQKLGQFLADVLQQGQDPAHIHIIGHSLGAHIAGSTGKAFLAASGRLLGRISALDPAGPCFSHVHPDMRLKHTDAAYVDVIHTDGGVYGLKDAIGHKDYYPNSGSMQPKCVLQSCSHSRSWILFGESVIFPKAFPAVQCDDWEAFKNGICGPNVSYMGYASEPDGRNGRYFLQTNDDYPYGLGLQGINYKSMDCNDLFKNLNVVRNIILHSMGGTCATHGRHESPKEVDGKADWSGVDSKDDLGGRSSDALEMDMRVLGVRGKRLLTASDGEIWMTKPRSTPCM